MLQSYPFATCAASLESPPQKKKACPFQGYLGTKVIGQDLFGFKQWFREGFFSDEGYGLIKGQAGGYQGVHRSDRN